MKKVGECNSPPANKGERNSCHLKTNKPPLICPACLIHKPLLFLSFEILLRHNFLPPWYDHSRTMVEYFTHHGATTRAPWCNNSCTMVQLSTHHGTHTIPSNAKKEK